MSESNSRSFTPNQSLQKILDLLAGRALGRFHVAFRLGFSIRYASDALRFLCARGLAAQGAPGMHPTWYYRPDAAPGQVTPMPLPPYPAMPPAPLSATSRSGRRSRSSSQPLSDVPLVYAIQGIEGGPIKLGTSKDVERRRECIQTSSPVRLCIRAACLGGVQREKEIHGILKSYRLHGEWFADSEEVLTFIGQNMHPWPWYPPQSSAADLSSSGAQSGL